MIFWGLRTQLLSSQKPHIIDGGSNDIDFNYNNPLLAALQRQSRYWTPLLLSWLNGGGNESNSEFNDNNVLDLPLTAKQRRHRQKITSSPPEVQIEALRALTALTEWTSHSGAHDDPISSVDVDNHTNTTNIMIG